MQAVMPSLFCSKPKFRLQDSKWNVSVPLREISVEASCSCPSCAMPIIRMQRSLMKTKILGVMMMINFLIYIIVEVTRSYDLGKSNTGQPLVPSNPFWKKSDANKAFWNIRQQHLDHLYNPHFFSAFTTDNVSFTEHQDLLNYTIGAHKCEPDYASVAQIKDYGLLPQRFKDFLPYMHCRSYPMLIDAPGVCTKTPFLLLVVKSMEPHFDRRQAIRQSWGQAGILNNRNIATVFLLGKTMVGDNYPNLSGMLRHEASLHGDLLQWDYRDTFFNLTLKEVLFLEWLAESCPSARYIFKGDDDVFVNTRGLLSFLNGLSKKKARDLFVGDVISDAGPQREKKVKYFIPESIFVGSYPPYAGGGGYLYSGSVALRLRNASRQVLLYPIDDVYTGMCLQRLGLVPKKHKGFKTFNIEEKYRGNACAYQSLLLVHPRTPQEMIKIWNWISEPGLKCEVKPDK